MPVLIQKPRGTADVLPPLSEAFRAAENMMAQTASSSGFREIRFPTFEKTALFERSSGDTSDVVSKEMYTFEDRSGEKITLRPEGTACVVRSFVENGLFSEPLPLKFYYTASCFRYGRPQAGRLREHHQFGMEIFGADSPAAEAEIISNAVRIFENLGIAGAVSVRLNSIGCAECRSGYRKALSEYLSEHSEKLCPTCLERMGRNPLRILDCKDPQCRSVCAGAPLITGYLCENCRRHLDGLRAILDSEGIAYVEDPMIIRGLDYYNGPVFEFVTDRLGAQSSIGAGGRYDGFVEQFGGPRTPALGCGLGIERMLLLAEACGKLPQAAPVPCRLYVIPVSEAERPLAESLAFRMRRAGIPSQSDLCSRSVRAAMRYAGKAGAEYVLVLGGDEAASGKYVLKRMSDSRETECAGEDGIIQTITKEV